MPVADEPVIPARRFLGWDIIVLVLAVALGGFLMITMSVRRADDVVIKKCQDRLMAISQAQQSYLVAQGQYAEGFVELVPYLDKEHRGMAFLCPITGRRLEMLVQQERYVVLAPGTGYIVNTGDASW